MNQGARFNLFKPK